MPLLHDPSRPLASFAAVISCRPPLRALASFASSAFASALTLLVAAHAQQPMGTVATHDALVTGGLEVQGEQARLLSNTSITAYDRTAPITLTRGGQVLVCSTSQFHLLHSGTGASLLFGLDRGALELHGPSDAQDVLLTPDIRFTLEAPGTFDLSLRVTRDGDTCVDNAGAGAPVLLLNDAFSAASYRLLPGQHVLFEHGSLREVVDHERSSCGCPAPAPTQLAANQHPFPAAASEDLAASAPGNNSAPAGEKHTQIAATLTFGTGPDGKPLPPPPATIAPVPAVPAAATAPPPTPPGAHDLFHAIGRFFHHLFQSGDKPNP